jgi:glycogen operon protein
MLLSGDTIDVQNFEGEPIRDNTFLLLINAHHEPLQFVLPGQKNVKWELELDTAAPEGFLEKPTTHVSGDELEIKNRATMLLKLTTSSTARARHESWKKRQFEAPHNGESHTEKPDEKTETPADGAGQSV